MSYFWPYFEPGTGAKDAQSLFLAFGSLCGPKTATKNQKIAKNLKIRIFGVGGSLTSICLWQALSLPFQWLTPGTLLPSLALSAMQACLIGSLYRVRLLGKTENPKIIFSDDSCVCVSFFFWGGRLSPHIKINMCVWTQNIKRKIQMCAWTKKWKEKFQMYVWTST